jgi:hypothetical protein
LGCRERKALEGREQKVLKMDEKDEGIVDNVEFGAWILKAKLADVEAGFPGHNGSTAHCQADGPLSCDHPFGPNQGASILS